MNKKRVSVLRIILEVVLQIIFFTSIGFALYFGILNPPLSDAYYLLYVVVATVIAYIARRVIKSASLFLMLHIALIVGALMMGMHKGDKEAFVFVLIVAILTLVSFVFRRMVVENKGDGFHIVFILIFLLEYLSGYASDNLIVMECSIWCAVAFIVAYIFYNMCARTENLFFINSDTSNFPGRRIISTNLIIVSLTSLGTLFGMFLFYNGPLGNIFVMIKNTLLKLLGWLLSFLLKPGDNSNIGEISTIELETEKETNKPFMLLPDSPLKDFFNAMVIIIAIVIVIVAIYFIVKAFRKMFSYVGRIAGADSDIIEDIDDDVANVETVKQNKEVEISDKDLNLRARKIYKKHVKSVRNEKGTPSDSALARDITKMFEEGDRADEITRVYEKARYSDETVTKEEVDIIKKST